MAAQSRHSKPEEGGERFLLIFLRLLRSRGLRVDTEAEAWARRAMALVGPAQQGDFFWALHCVLVRSAAESVVFAEAFARAFPSFRIKQGQRYPPSTGGSNVPCTYA